MKAIITIETDTQGSTTCQLQWEGEPANEGEYRDAKIIGQFCGAAFEAIGRLYEAADIVTGTGPAYDEQLGRIKEKWGFGE